MKELRSGEVIRIQGEVRSSGLVEGTTTSGETVTFFYSDLSDRAERVAAADG